jgi:hypothetical protein
MPSQSKRGTGRRTTAPCDGATAEIPGEHPQYPNVDHGGRQKDAAMKLFGSIIIIASALALTPAVAQKSDNSAKEFAPGQQQGPAKKYAPGQRQTKPGEAKKFAPGQKQHQQDSTTGRSERTKK